VPEPDHQSMLDVRGTADTLQYLLTRSQAQITGLAYECARVPVRG
jgi:hypothetical protein